MFEQGEAESQKEVWNYLNNSGQRMIKMIMTILIKEEQLKRKWLEEEKSKRKELKKKNMKKFNFNKSNKKNKAVLTFPMKHTIFQ
jgi:hypothetical protein